MLREFAVGLKDIFLREPKLILRYYRPFCYPKWEGGQLNECFDGG